MNSIYLKVWLLNYLLLFLYGNNLSKTKEILFRNWIFNQFQFNNFIIIHIFFGISVLKVKMDSFKKLQEQFFAGELSEEDYEKIMDAFNNWHLQDKTPEKSKPSVKNLTTLPDPNDSGYLPVPKAKNDLPDTSKSGMQELELRPTKFYVQEIGLPS